MLIKQGSLSVLLFLITISSAIGAENDQDDVLFVVLGKTANYRQTENGRHSLLNYHFFAEIFLRENGLVKNAALLIPGPNNRELRFDGNGSVLEAHGGRYKTEDELNRIFPDGTYIFSYRLSDGRLINESVMIRNSMGRSRIPSSVTIKLSQDGKPVLPARVDADRDLKITWNAFESGNANPNGIVDDLIFVVTGNCHGEKIDHSGGPFAEEDYLTFAANEYLIPASRLEPGETYQIFVEHAEIDSSLYRNIPEIATYASTSFLDIRTGGNRKQGRKACPELMPAMDGGQTDRPPKK